MMRKILAGVVLLVVLMLLPLLGKFVENVGASEIIVVQAPWSGKMTWYTSPGTKWQGFGTVTVYKRRGEYKFSGKKIGFNDGGTATADGSVQYDMPLDVPNLAGIHGRYPSQDAVDQVMATVVDKVLFMTGPLMSSRESYAEKRTDLIRYVQDQIDLGVYQNQTKTVESTDPLTGARSSITTASIVMGTDGRPVRQDKSVVGEFGIRAFNFAISSIDYDDKVDNQIAQQQQIKMDVETSIAEARKAEQRRITTEQQGQANAAEAKWKQETIRAQAVVQGEQQRDVAKLDADAAEQYRRAQLLRADADATYKRQVMQADGALAQKLATIEKIHAAWAAAFQHHQGPMVPSVVMGGGSGASATSNAETMMGVIAAKALKDLGLDMGIKP